MAIFFAVLIVCLVTTVNDYKKERQFEKLNEIAESEKTVACTRVGLSMEKVIVDGKEEQHLQRTHIDDLVVGDIIKIETGKTIPADGILIDGQDIEMDESAVTGESDYMKKMTYEECRKKVMAIRAKNPDHLDKPKAVPSPILLSGTKVFKGTGRYMVIVVGKISFMGELKESLEDERGETPLQQKLDLVAGHIGIIGLIAAIATVVVMLISFFITRIRDEGWGWSDLGLCFSYIVIGITVLVVAIPEGLPLAVTIALAYSVMKMLEQKNFVKTLMACETMGGVNNICTDKTGTLTKNLMTTLEVWICGKPYNVEKGDEELRKALPKERIQTLFEIIGCNLNVDNPNATEQGFKNFLDACKYDYMGVRKKFMSNPESYKKILFTSERKKSSTIITKDDADWLYTFGNVYTVLDACSSILQEDGTEIPLTIEIRNKLTNDITTANRRALRTLGMAMKKLTTGEGGEDHLAEDEKGKHIVEESGLVFIGYIGLRDQLRENVPEAIEVLTKKAGVTVRMVTGDNYETAIAIARECGILGPNTTIDKDIAMIGIEFYERVGGKVEICRGCTEKATKTEGDTNKPKSLAPAPEIKIDIDKGAKGEKICIWCGKKLEITAGNLEEFKKLEGKLRVIAACRPNDKYLLVAGLKYLGNVVGVTGDGSNDAPALNKADIGLAMDAGTDLAKDAAGIVLMDNSFASIQTAVNWGRNIFDAIRKFIQFQLTVNVVALVLAFVGSAIISQSPLTAVQLLWVNLIMDSLASLALATDPPTPDQLERPPVGRDEYIITKVSIGFNA